jgi:RimJ/RimL family protein N-acetyltransferase
MEEGSVRSARVDDEDRLFQWRNDPWIVSLSGSQREVTRDEHAAWFLRTVHSPDHLVLVVEVNGEPAGSVRFDRSEHSAAVVTIYLLQPFTGRGLGVAALREGCHRAFERWPDLLCVRAHINRDNRRSARAFGKAGFIVEGSSMAQRRPQVDMVLRRTDMLVTGR